MILITGAGTLGTALVKEITKEDELFQDDIRVVDYSEEALWRLEEATGERNDVEVVLADICDRERMRLAMKDVHTVFHTAALKHVKYTNDNPIECIRTNIEGTANLLTLAVENDVRIFVNMSSDKACLPNNIYGDSKKVGERLTTWASTHGGRYFSVRSGNFLGSRGSVFDRWKEQRTNGKIKLTSPHMNRFFIKPDQMAEWLVVMAEVADGGIVATPFVKNLNMGLVATVVAEKWGVDIEEVGAGAGEKLDEMLISHEEASRTAQQEHLGWWTYPHKVDMNVKGAISTNVVPVLGREETEYYLEGTI